MHLHGEYKHPGAKLVVVDLECSGGRLYGVRVSGDFFLQPESALDTIDAALCGMPASASEEVLADAVRAALDPGVLLYGISPEAVAVAVRRAVDSGTAA